MNGTDNNFYREVYSIVREIPYGHVCTYGIIARLGGQPQYARMVGRALANVPGSLRLPCHRVVNSQGRLAPQWPEQKELLQRENITLKNNGCVNLGKHLWNPL